MASDPEPPYHLLLEADEVALTATALRLLISDEAHEPQIRQLARDVLAGLEGAPDEQPGVLSLSLASRQMKITHTALRALYVDLGREQAGAEDAARHPRQAAGPAHDARDHARLEQSAVRSTVQLVGGSGDKTRLPSCCTSMRRVAPILSALAVLNVVLNACPCTATAAAATPSVPALTAPAGAPLTPAQQHFLALAQEGVAAGQPALAGQAAGGWYDARLGDRERYPLATIWDSVPLFESLDAIAIAQPTPREPRGADALCQGSRAVPEPRAAPADRATRRTRAIARRTRRRGSTTMAGGGWRS